MQFLTETWLENRTASQPVQLQVKIECLSTDERHWPNILALMGPESLIKQ